MTIDRIILIFAGAMILLSIALAQFVDPWWLLLGVFVGLNMIQAGFSRFCPLAMILKALGVPRGAAF